MSKQKDMATFGDRFREVRKRNSFSQDWLGQLLGYKKGSSISNIEAGISRADNAALAKLAKAVDVDLHWLITGDQSPAVIAERQKLESLRQRVRAVVLEACPEFDSLRRITAEVESTDEQGGINDTEK